MTTMTKSPFYTLTLQSKAINPEVPLNRPITLTELSNWVKIPNQLPHVCSNSDMIVGINDDANDR